MTVTNTTPLIYIVEDDPTLSLLIESALQQVELRAQCFAEAGSFLKMVERVGLSFPSVLLCDVHLPDMRGLELQERLIEKGISVPTIFMTAFGAIEDAVRAMERGARGYITKPFGTGDLVEKISDILREDDLDPAGRQALQAQHQAYRNLTERQKEIIKLLVDGNSSKVIARMLGISPRTVDVHRAHIMMRLEATNAAELVSIYWKMKLFFGL